MKAQSQVAKGSGFNPKGNGKTDSPNVEPQMKTIPKLVKSKPRMIRLNGGELVRFRF